nr:MAG TPA: hypothetical protein [Caudoviricetes sp.]
MNSPSSDLSYYCTNLISLVSSDRRGISCFSTG